MIYTATAASELSTSAAGDEESYSAIGSSESKPQSRLANLLWRQMR